MDTGVAQQTRLQTTVYAFRHTNLLEGNLARGLWGLEEMVWVLKFGRGEKGHVLTRVYRVPRIGLHAEAQSPLHLAPHVSMLHLCLQEPFPSPSCDPILRIAWCLRTTSVRSQGQALCPSRLE
jgi:hypothetical protein